MAVDLELSNVKIIPVSATEGDNVTKKSENMPWYREESLLDYLENVDVNNGVEEAGFVMPVQRVCRPNHTYRGFQGQIESGEICVGDEVTVLPSKEKACVQSILKMNQEVKEAQKGQPVSIQLNREIDVSRGCVLIKNAELKVANMFSATMLWMDDTELVEGKSYYIKIGTKMMPATVMNIKYKIDVNTGEHVPVESVYKNEIVYCDIALAEEVVFDKFENHKAVGSYILIDRVTNMTSACGIINHALRRSENLVWQKLDITREVRAEKLGQKPVTIWFTGLSGAGKSSLANEIEKILTISGKHTMLLDGDNVRMGLNKNLGFQEKDRIENIRRVAEVAKLMNDGGLIVLASFISPYQSDRRNARRIIGEENFIEIYVSTPLEECEKRDVKGHYKKARNGEIPNFTGISSPFEVPEHPEITIDTSKCTLEEAANYVVEQLKNYL